MTTNADRVNSLSRWIFQMNTLRMRERQEKEIYIMKCSDLTYEYKILKENEKLLNDKLENCADHIENLNQQIKILTEQNLNFSEEIKELKQELKTKDVKEDIIKNANQILELNDNMKQMIEELKTLQKDIHPRFDSLQSLGTVNIFDATVKGSLAAVQFWYYQPLFDQFGESYMHYAAEKGYIDILEFFCSKKININCRNKRNESPLLVALKKNNSFKTIELLIKYGASIDVADCLMISPLHWTSFFGNTTICEYLLSRGANIEAGDHLGFRPLHTAICEGHLKIVQLLIAKGADVNSKNRSGSTPLHVAYQKNKQPIIDYLNENGADNDARDNKGNTPKDYQEFVLPIS